MGQMNWKALERSEILKRVDKALAKNQNYDNNPILGIPGTYLDEEEFYKDAEFLKTAPFLKTMVANPNHIGCHTLGHSSSPIFKGTHEIEKELIGICAEQIFKGKKGQQDGYVATGGTEANLEAMWIYRNYFRKEYGAKPEQIGVLFSEDTHYSIAKGCDLLQVKPVMLSVENETRQIIVEEFKNKVNNAIESGVKYFIVIINLSTTMFGSVDKIDPIASYLEQKEYPFKIHLDAAFGGFIYPFTNPNSEHNFSNPRVSSISIDGHKMLQTPYGTGLFLIRKGFMHYVTTDEAQYVPGLDFTICGSRSGANAVVIWMLLMTYGAQGWKRKMNELIERTDYLCKKLDEMKIAYFRNPHINIVTIQANQIPDSVAKKYELVADSYEHKPTWWKIVVMDHAKKELLKRFINEVYDAHVKL
jgi:glutamate/tyrosine decarboxylase-like PLP-dependent enzyme